MSNRALPMRILAPNRVYRISAPATHRMGRPTLRRHSSTIARMPMTAKARSMGSLDTFA